MARKIKGEPKNLDEAIYLMDRGRLTVGARTREEAVQLLKERFGGDTTDNDDNGGQGASEDPDDVDYDSWNMDALRDEIDRRNESRDEEDQLARSGKKAELVAVLEEDDEFGDD